MPPHDPVGVFWDYEHCAPPSNTLCYDTVHRIRDVALKYGTVKTFKTYLRLSDVTSTTGHDLLSCSVNTTNCETKDAVDKMMLVDMMQFGWENPAPATVVVVFSGGRDFAYAVSVLRLHHCHVVVVAPSSSVSDSLKCQASVFHDWAVVMGKHASSVRPGPGAVSFRPPHPPQLLSTHHLPSRPSPSTSTSFTSGQLPTPSSVMGSSSIRHASTSAGGFSRELSANTSIWSPLGAEDSPTRRLHRPHELNGSAHYMDRHQHLNDPWGSAKSPISPSAYGCAMTSSGDMTPVRGKPQVEVVPEEEVTLTEEPCEEPADLAESIRHRMEDVKSCGQRPGRAMPQRAPSSLPTPKSPRPTDSPVMRPATAGPIMEGTGSMTPSKEEDEDEDEDDTGFMHMSVQTMPAGPSHSREGSDETVMSNRRPLERHFLPLVHVLEELRGQGIYQPLRSTVALSIVKLDSRVYQNAKVAKWKPYADLAYKAGVVELGGAEGTAWISLLPEWRGLNMDDVQ